MEKLRTQLRQIDHKGYKAYKTLEGEYNFGTYRLCIDHVQGDPFATPSRVQTPQDCSGRLSFAQIDPDDPGCIGWNQKRLWEERYSHSLPRGTGDPGALLHENH